MADPQFAECSNVTSKPSIRRRGCVVCLRPTPNAYVTSFTRVAEKQSVLGLEVWVNLLANGDEGFANHLKVILATGRKYLCLDHFDRQHLVHRKHEDGMEVVRNSMPIPFVGNRPNRKYDELYLFQKNVDFIRHEFSEQNEPSTSEPFVSLEDEVPEVPAKRQKLEVNLAGKGAELDVASMTYLMDTVNLYVTRAMEEADKK
ncbi:hypothetical protein B9Z55_020455 [Caenorhabditis nigoni]|uniref:Uncharacterized protein n=1 Tax=Caenorhabditis nigoni TaxID=1611254 RepID=A0A2G5TMU1_9PELO|nr:hypothetical protein B9Z55_020455 [Caenorhabditis nigoni]